MRKLTINGTTVKQIVSVCGAHPYREVEFRGAVCSWCKINGKKANAPWRYWTYWVAVLLTFGFFMAVVYFSLF